jgi:hypothetical protein
MASQLEMKLKSNFRFLLQLTQLPTPPHTGGHSHIIAEEKAEIALIP